MNFLELCQRLREESGVAGAISTTQNQTGMNLKLVHWVQRAYIDILTRRPYWRFLRNHATVTLQINKRTYNVASDLLLTTVDKWDPEGAFIYEVSDADQTQVIWQDYALFRRYWNKGFGPGRPGYVTEQQGDTLAFDRIPDKAYTVIFDYWMTPEKLQQNADVPSIPEQFHDIIIWRALQLYAGSEEVPQLYQHATAQYNPMLMLLTVDQVDVPVLLKSYPTTKGNQTASASTPFRTV